MDGAWLLKGTIVILDLPPSVIFSTVSGFLALVFAISSMIFRLTKRIVDDQFRKVSMAHENLTTLVSNHQLSDRDQHQSLSTETKKQAADINDIKIEIRGLSVKFESIESKIEQLLKLVQK